MIWHVLALARFLILTVLILVIGIILWALYVAYWLAMWISCLFHKDWETYYVSWKEKLIKHIK